MGKSNKKIKNDRINTIRKQYDAFLEEDKKRRERNEYILGKLDKMRLTTALVPKANYHTELNSTEIFMRPSNLRAKTDLLDSYVTHLGKTNVTTGILNKPVDELRILKEISKNYILIPKRKPIENDYIYSRDVDDQDWRNKYNILDDLKKLEKEGQSISICDRRNGNKELNLSMDSNNSDKQPAHAESAFDKPISITNNELINKSIKSPMEQKKIEQNNINVPKITIYESEKIKLPFEIAYTKTNEGTKDDHNQLAQYPVQECNINPQEETITEKEKYNTEGNEKNFNLDHNFSNSPQISDTTDVTHSAVYQEKDNDSISTEATKKYISPENIDGNISNVAISEQTIFDVKSQEPSAEKFPRQSIHLDQNIDNLNDLTSTERVELYDDTENNPESQLVSEEPIIEKSNIYDPVQNTIPVDLEDIQQPEGGHESEINAFEAEQKEMFYSEQTHGETYAYNQDESNTEAYTDGYEQNDQYAYYGVQEEQAYANTINEHEESTERYDPHYNEQYEQTYQNQQPDETVAYENTNAYEQQQQFQDDNPQFENTVNYEHQQQNVQNENEVQENVLPQQDNHLYEQHSYVEQPGLQEQIEQQLVTEEGYTESLPVIVNEILKENEDKIENVTGLTPEEQILDPKLS